MTLTYRVPEFICIHDRDTWMKLAQENGIDFDKKVFVYRDFKSGQYVIKQETVDDIALHNGR